MSLHSIWAIQQNPVLHIHASSHTQIGFLILFFDLFILNILRQGFSLQSLLFWNSPSRLGWPRTHRFSYLCLRHAGIIGMCTMPSYKIPNLLALQGEGRKNSLSSLLHFGICECGAESCVSTYQLKNIGYTQVEENGCS